MIILFLEKFWSFRLDPQFNPGYFTELYGILTEIIIFALLVPVAIKIYNFRRNRMLEFQVYFYMFQIFHKFCDAFICHQKIHNVPDFLINKYQKEFRSGDLKIFSHYVFGNLTNKIYLLEKTITEKEVPIIFKNLSYKDFVKTKKDLSRILIEMDRLHSLIPGMPNLQEQMFSLRLMIYTGIDLFDDMATSKFKSDRDYRKYLEANLSIVKAVFEDRKKFVERQWNWNQNKNLIIMVLKISKERLKNKLCEFFKKKKTKEVDKTIE